MEATKLFDWLKVIDFPTISAHNHMVFIIQAPLLPTFFYYDWSFLDLFITKRDTLPDLIYLELFYCNTLYNAIK